ncbi:MAG: hypothetical protein V7784_03485 [Oceanospirillaceae bacterium]
MYQQGFKQFQDLIKPFNTQMSKQLSANISLLEKLVSSQANFISQTLALQREFCVGLNTEKLNAAQGLPDLIELHKKHSSLTTQRTQQYWANAFQIMQTHLQVSTNDTVVSKASIATENEAVKGKLNQKMKREQVDKKPAGFVTETVKRVQVKSAVNRKAVVASKTQISKKTNKADISEETKLSPKVLINTPVNTLVKASAKAPVKPSVEENRVAIQDAAKIVDKVVVKVAAKAVNSEVLKPASDKKLDSKKAASAATIQPISNKVKVVDKLVKEDGK